VNFVDDLNQNYSALRDLLREWIVDLIHENRPMWRDDGVDLTRADIIDILGSITRDGNKITIGSLTAAVDADTLDTLHAAAFTSPKYLVTEADANLTAEVVVGATPGGELGGTWASPTVDATHSGSAHHAAVTVAADLSPLITLSAQELSFAAQNANKVLAGPTSGGDADPTVRALVAADIPDVSATYVPKSLYDAQSVLAATADNTPAAVTVAQQTVVGRLTGGDIDDIAVGIADDNIVQVDQYDAADNDYAKFTAAGIEGRSYAEVVSDLGALTTTAHTAIGDGAPHHAQSHNHSAAGDGTVLTPVTVDASTSVSADHLYEHTATHGVDIDGVLCKDDAVETDAIRGLRESGGTSLAMGAVADGQHLKRSGATVVGDTLTATFIAKSIVDLKGDLIVAEADNDVGVLAAGANGTVLTADSGEAMGLKWAAAPGGGVATDAIWDAAGDLAVGSGANTAAKLAKGTDAQVLTMVAGAVAWAAAAGGGAMATDPLWDAAGDLAVGTGANTGAKLALTVPGAANLMNVLGVVNGETTPVWKVLFNDTHPEPIGVATEGTGVVAARLNHVHSNTVILSWLFSGNCTVKTHEKKFKLPFATDFSDVKLLVLDGNEPTGDELIVDIQFCTDDATWDTTFSTLPEIDIAAQEDDGNHAQAHTAYAANTYFICKCTQIGSTLPGVGLGVDLILTR